MAHLSEYFDCTSEENPKVRKDIISNIQLKNIDKNVNISDKNNSLNNSPNLIIDSNERKFENYCRLCATLKPINCLFPLFEKFSLAALNILNSSIPQKMIKDDNLPQKVCSECVERFLLYLSILKDFQEADSKLRLMYDLQLNAEDGGNNLEIESNLTTDNARKMDDPLDIFVLKYQCIFCLEMFNDKTEIMTHVTKTHPLNKTNLILSRMIKVKVKNHNNNKENTLNNDLLRLKYQCVSCNEIFNEKIKLVKHVEKLHYPLQHNQIISRIIKEDTIFNNYDTTVTNRIVTRLYCTNCKLLFKDNNQATQHYSEIHSYSEKEEKKEKEEQIISKSLKNKNPSTSVNNKYKCLICLNLFNTSELFTQHAIDHHPNADHKKIFCKYLTPKRRLRTLKKSKELSVLNIKYKCINCENFFERNIDLTIHVVLNHPDMDLAKIATIVIEKKLTNDTSTQLDNVNNEKIVLRYQCISCYSLCINHNDFIKHCQTHKKFRQKFVVCKLISVNLKETLNRFKDLIGIDPTLIEIDVSKYQKSNKEDIYCKKYQCEKCQKLFLTKNILVKHTLKFHPTSELNKIASKFENVKKQTYYNDVECTSYENINTRYECLICCCYFISKMRIVQHMCTVHPIVAESNKIICRSITNGNEPTSCLHCSVSLTNSDQKYFEHMQTHLFYPCNICGLTFKRFNQIKKHKLIHKFSKKIFCCLLCNNLCANYKDISQHLKVHQSIIYECFDCNLQFSSKDKLTQHEDVHRIPNDDCSCDKCGKKFISSFDLRKHKQVHESVLCNVCGKLFSTKSRLTKHMESHVEDRLFSCNECHKKYKTRRNLIRHRFCHVNEKNFICQICGKQFRLQGSLHQHMQLHSEKKHKCDLCDKAFHRKTYLRRHQQRHINANNLNKTLRTRSHENKVVEKCIVCKLEFSNIHDLSLHYETHNEITLYKCHLCDRVFKGQLYLSQHQIVHQEAKYECQFCGSKFRRWKTLFKHELRHSTDEQFQCPNCTKRFNHRKNMILHRRTHFKINEQNQNINDIENIENPENIGGTGNIENTEETNYEYQIQIDHNYISFKNIY